MLCATVLYEYNNSVTCYTIFLILASEDLFGNKVRIPDNLLFGFYAVILTVVVYWEAYLSLFH
ncbi:MAG TPA: hypothetical protein ENG28_02305 [Deltaproteobacteria bacterium]|nr:hypothetical protein [Deltaproteobacteria bacterium]